MSDCTASLERRVLELLDDVEGGAVELVGGPDTSDGFWAWSWVDYTTPCGWRLQVFIDLGEFDYLESFTTPEGQSVDFEDMTRALQNYRPPTVTERERWRIPGLDPK